MALTDAEKKELREEAAREKARGAETDEQKWVRGAIREEIKDILGEFFAPDEDEGKGKPGGPGKSFLDGVLGRTGS
jgi:hypothetical protein